MNNTFNVTLTSDKFAINMFYDDINKKNQKITPTSDVKEKDFSIYGEVDFSVVSKLNSFIFIDFYLNKQIYIFNNSVLSNKSNIAQYFLKSEINSEVNVNNCIDLNSLNFKLNNTCPEKLINDLNKNNNLSNDYLNQVYIDPYINEIKTETYKIISDILKKK
jgi:hypothetical protein